MLPFPQLHENKRNSAAKAGCAIVCNLGGTSLRPLPLVAMVMLFAPGIGGMVAAQELLCLSPALPLLDLPEEVLVAYRAEISGEFESYFAAVTEYIACLDSERARVMAEVRDAATAYSDFLNLPRVEEDIR